MVLFNAFARKGHIPEAFHSKLQRIRRTTQLKTLNMINRRIFRVSNWLDLATCLIFSLIDGKRIGIRWSSFDCSPL